MYVLEVVSRAFYFIILIMEDPRSVDVHLQRTLPIKIQATKDEGKQEQLSQFLDHFFSDRHTGHTGQSLFLRLGADRRYLGGRLATVEERRGVAKL